MEKRFEKRAEAGGEQSVDGSKNSPKWREHFKDKFRNYFKSDEIEKQTDELENKSVTPLEFVVGIFRRDNPASETKTQSWIEEAFSEKAAQEGGKKAALETPEVQKLGELDEQTRTEFYMVVAERFRAAGERFIGMTSTVVSRDNERAAEPIDKTIESAPPLFEVSEIVDTLDSSADELPTQDATEAIKDDSTQNIDFYNSGPSYPEAEYSPLNRQNGEVKPSYIKNQTPKSVVSEGDVHQYVYRTRIRDSIFGDRRPVSRRKAKKAERKLKDSIKAQQDRFKEQQAAIERIQKRISHQRDTPPINFKQTEVSSAWPTEIVSVEKQQNPSKVETTKAPPTRKDVQQDWYPIRGEQKTVSLESMTKATTSKEDFLAAFAKEREQIKKSEPKVIEELSFADLKPLTKKTNKVEVKPETQEIPVANSETKEYASTSATSSFPQAQQTPSVDSRREPSYFQKPTPQQPSIQQPKQTKADNQAQASNNQWMPVFVILVLVAVSILFIASV